MTFKANLFDSCFGRHVPVMRLCDENCSIFSSVVVGDFVRAYRSHNRELSREPENSNGSDSTRAVVEYYLRWNS